MRINYFLFVFFLSFNACCFAQDSLVTQIQQIEESIETPNIPERTINVLDYGVKTDDAKNDKPGFDKAIAALVKAGGGILKVPKGSYLLKRPIHLKSKINLHLEAGAVLNFSDTPSDYPLVATSWEGTFIYNYSPLIYAYQAEDLAITGSGTINGNGDGIWATFKTQEEADKLSTRKMNHQQTKITSRRFGNGHFLRPQLVQFFDSKRILLEGVRFENSPFWCVHLLRSNNITIDGISYDSQNKNNDGIDLEYASNVVIKNVVI